VAEAKRKVRGGTLSVVPDAPKPRVRGALRVLVLSGPNLDRLGKREPEIYGKATLAEVHERIAAAATLRKVLVDCRQSNHEGALIDWIGTAADDGFSGILINPGALTHSSYALYDALKGSPLPTIEVHLSNPDAREAFRKNSLVAPACVGRVAGFGAASYTLALTGLLDRLQGS
jgi:3-dehydroquinate dehydratase-2